MPCEAFTEDLQAYLDGELAPLRRAVLEAHLRECADCNAVLLELKNTSHALAHWTDREPSDKFEFLLQLKLSTENLPADDASAKTASVPTTAPAARRPAPPSALRWFITGWRPAVAVVSLLSIFVLVVALQNINWRRTSASRPAGDIMKAFMDAGPDGAVSDACVYAATVGKRNIEKQDLNAPRLAQSDVIYSFLASLDSDADKSAGWTLINLLSSRTHPHERSYGATVASLFGGLGNLLWRDLYAAGAPTDPLLLARRFELQGRLNDALLRYDALTEGDDVSRARLAAGALRLRMGDLDGAAATLEAASHDSARIIANCALALLDEVDSARTAHGDLSAVRQTAKTCRDWFDVALLEVSAYDFRNAANSFMKAANACQSADHALRNDARFRSAWCHKETGQLSTALYGFRTVAADPDAPAQLAYTASIEEAVALTRIGRFEDSVSVCRDLVRKPSPGPTLEALAYFQKGSVELRYLKDVKAASESLSRVASNGQGHLSYAAQKLLNR